MSGSADHVNIYSNRAADTGGGIFCYDGGFISNCTIEANESLGKAGGVLVRRNALIAGCNIRYNHTGDGVTEDGGGIFYYNGGTVRDCLITGNSATDCGGGVMFSTSPEAPCSIIARWY